MTMACLSRSALNNLILINYILFLLFTFTFAFLYVELLLKIFFFIFFRLPLILNIKQKPHLWFYVSEFVHHFNFSLALSGSSYSIKNCSISSRLLQSTEHTQTKTNYSVIQSERSKE